MFWRIFGHIRFHSGRNYIRCGSRHNRFAAHGESGTRNKSGFRAEKSAQIEIVSPGCVNWFVPCQVRQDRMTLCLAPVHHHYTKIRQQLLRADVDMRVGESCNVDDVGLANFL